ncbi:hypothetical protein Pelo_11931 [Pelomyxa schiedti]|nr:hypothetical protein Pelo_11931 [Pelomyxa schiedti]
MPGRFLFPKTAKETVHFVANPYSLVIENERWYGTSGQNVSTFKERSHLDSTVDVMETMINMRHMMPTVPFYCPSLPLDQDPFLLEHSPNVFFAGCQGTCSDNKRLPCGTWIVSVPEFTQTHMVLLIDVSSHSLEKLVLSLNPII